MDSDLDLDNIKQRMEGALSSMSKDFDGLRTGRASASLLDNIKVEVYGSEMPLNQVGTVSVLEARMLGVNVWDKGNVAAVEKAIINSGLGLNPITEGQSMRIPMPQVTEERRKEMTKVAAKYAEDTRIAVRNVRRDGMDKIKKLQNDKAISEDDGKFYSEDVQKLTDEFISKIDAELDAKNKEIMTV